MFYVLSFLLISNHLLAPSSTSVFLFVCFFATLLSYNHRSVIVSVSNSRNSFQKNILWLTFAACMGSSDIEEMAPSLCLYEIFILC